MFHTSFTPCILTMAFVVNTLFLKQNLVLKTISKVVEWDLGLGEEIFLQIYFLVGIVGQTSEGGLKSWLCFKVLTLETNVKELSTLNVLDTDRKQLGLRAFDIVE